jgi:hypothetical protein
LKNAIKHGISETPTGGEVHHRPIVTLRRVRGLGFRLLISVLDTGVGVTEAALAQRRKRGLAWPTLSRLQHYGHANFDHSQRQDLEQPLKFGFPSNSRPPTTSCLRLKAYERLSAVASCNADDERSARSFLASVLRKFDDVETAKRRTALRPSH